MLGVEAFLSPIEEQEIIAAIRKAEQNTSGEIRIHLENTSALTSIDRAKEVFHFLKMDNTKFQNGVLIYVAVKDRSFAIYGDKGIDDVVPDGFWEHTKNTIKSNFQQGQFSNGLIEGVISAGEQLEKHFPWFHDDTNELTNEISKG